MRTLTDIRQDIERATERRGELLRSLARRHDPGMAAEHTELEGVVARLWDEHRAARARLRFGDREQIIHRARAEERLERAA